MRKTGNLYSTVDRLDYEVKFTANETQATYAATTSATSEKTTTTLTTTTSRSGQCPPSFKTEAAVWKQLDTITPKYNLRRDHYLMHVLSNGPNNQLSDLKKGLYFSIKLNRTFVMPLFFEHMTIFHPTFIYPESQYITFTKFNKSTLRSHPAPITGPFIDQRRSATNGRTVSLGQCRHV